MWALLNEKIIVYRRFIFQLIEIQGKSICWFDQFTYQYAIEYTFRVRKQIRAKFVKIILK